MCTKYISMKLGGNISKSAVYLLCAYVVLQWLICFMSSAQFDVNSKFAFCIQFNVKISIQTKFSMNFRSAVKNSKGDRGKRMKIPHQSIKVLHTENIDVLDEKYWFLDDYRSNIDFYQFSILDIYRYIVFYIRYMHTFKKLIFYVTNFKHFSCTCLNKSN